jgi:hypothetical protein
VEALKASVGATAASADEVASSEAGARLSAAQLVGHLDLEAFGAAAAVLVCDGLSRLRADVADAADAPSGGMLAGGPRGEPASAPAASLRVELEPELVEYDSEAEGDAPAEGEVEHEATAAPPRVTEPFAKFTDGYEGTFATISAFFGGLPKLIGEPRRDVVEGMRAEHCGVAEGFGRSDGEVAGLNNNVAFTPRREYLFVCDPAFDEPMRREV